MQTTDFERAVAEWLTSMTQIGSVLFLFISFSMFYAPHYMRRRVVQAETPISRLMSDGEEEYHRLFGRVSAIKPQAIVWLFVSVFFVSSSSLTNPGFSVPRLLSGLSFFPFFFLGLTSTLWSYSTSLYGIRKMGTTPLQLRPYFEDSTLGLKPVGSLALSLVMTYFALIGLLVTPAIVLPLDLYVVMFLSVLIILGLLMFFLPLTRLHQLMLEQKRAEKDKLSTELAQKVRGSSEAASSADFSQVLMLEMMERKVSSMAVWPFDTKILGKLTVIVLSLIAILLSRVIGKYLGI